MATDKGTSRIEPSPAPAGERAEEARNDSESRLKREVAHGPRDVVTIGGVEDGANAASTVVVEPAGRPQSRFSLPFVDPVVTGQVFALAWPIATGMLGETAMGLVDTKLVAGLGAAALGGVGVGATLMHLAYSIVYGMMRGVKVASSHAIGEGRAADGFAYARAGLALGLAIGVFELFLCRNPTPILVALGIDATVVPHAADFLRAVTLGAPAACALAALVQHRQAMGDTRTPMVVGIAGNVVNAALGWALIYGRFGLPALGVAGSGYATAISEVLELGVLFALLLRDERAARRRNEAPTLRIRAAAREVLGIGGPTSVQFGAEMLAFTTFTVLIGGLGSHEIAAHQIALSVIRVSFLPGIAVAEAGSVLLGQALGRRRLDEGDAVVRSALVMASSFMAVCGVGFAIFGRAIAGAFAVDAGVVDVARRLLLVAALFQVLDAVNIVLRSALRAAKDVRIVLLVGVATTWTFIPTAAWVLGKWLGLGALGGWFGFLGETTVGAVLLAFRFRNGSWRARFAPTQTTRARTVPA